MTKMRRINLNQSLYLNKENIRILMADGTNLKFKLKI